MNLKKTLGYRNVDVAKNYQDLKSHSFFEGVDFNQIEPPQVNKELRLAFNDVYVEQQLQLGARYLADYQSVVDIQQISQENDDQHEQFSFGNLPQFVESKSEIRNKYAQEKPNSKFGMFDAQTEHSFGQLK